MFGNNLTIDLCFLPNCGLNRKTSSKIKAKLFEDKQILFSLLGDKKNFKFGGI